MDKIFNGNDFVEGYSPKLSSDGVFSSTPNEHFEYMEMVLKNNITGIRTVLELCACSGADTIRLARDYTVDSFEINEDNFDALKSNVSMCIYNESISIHNKSFEESVKLGKKFDMIYYDPPWGERHNIDNKRVYEPFVFSNSNKDFISIIEPIIKETSPVAIIIKIPQYVLQKGKAINTSEFIKIKGYKLLHELPMITTRNKQLYSFLFYTLDSYDKDYLPVNSLRMIPFNYRLL